MHAPPDELLEEINKRLTLNLLIQGSAQHAFLTSHYLVRDELTAINPELVTLYDKFSIAAFMSFWYGTSVLFFGRPSRFWKRVTRGKHSFSRHPLLAHHGESLAAAAKARAVERSREKGVSRLPVAFSSQLVNLLTRLVALEQPHKVQLVQLAKQVTHTVWGIPHDRLDAELTKNVAFGRQGQTRTFAGWVLRASAVGYGGVLRQNTQLQVMAKARLWPLLSHELVKGTAELVCLQGLNDLEDTTYAAVIEAADRIEYEPWMLQAGSELWRRILTLLPNDIPLAEILMHIARLSPKLLERLMISVLEDRDKARGLFASLAPERL